MNPSQSIQRRLASTPSMHSWADVRLLREACDAFLELRREPSSRATSLVVATAMIGRHPVVLLVQRWGVATGKRGKKEVGRWSIQSRKSQHLLRLAKRFKRPIVVCVVDPPSTAMSAALRRDVASPIHLFSQWVLDVPVILLVTAARVSFGVFGTWLADRSISLAQTKFILDRPEQSGRPGPEIEAKELLRHKILDDIIPAPTGGTRSQGKLASHKVRHLLMHLLDDVIKLTPMELKSIRKERLARAESLVFERV